MSQTELLNSILSRKIKKGVGQHVSGNLTRPGQLWATSSHRNHYDNALKLISEYGGKSVEFARQILETLVGTYERHRVLFFFTVAEESMTLLISTTYADHTAAGVISLDGLELHLDEEGKIIDTDVPNMKPVRHENHPSNYLVFYLPTMASILGKKAP